MKLRNRVWRLLGGALLLGSQGVYAEIVVVNGDPIVLQQSAISARRTGRTNLTMKTNAPPPVLVVRTEDTLSLLNGDKLHGKLVGMDGAAGILTWQHKAVRDPLCCSMAALNKVDLLPRKVEGMQVHKNIVQLVNGDRLSGDVVSLSASELVVKSWYAGTLHIARQRLAELTPAAAPLDVLYEGPTSDLSGWAADSGGGSSGLAFRGGGLVLPLGRAVGRKIPNMPEKVRFDIEVTGFAGAYFAFWFFNDSTRNMGSSDAYLMNFYNTRIDFQRMTRHEGSRSLGSVENEDRRAPKNRLLITILADRKERHFTVLLDGKLAREFNDPQEFKGTGDCVMFQTHQASAMRISKFRVAQWDGKPPKSGSSSSGAVEQDTLEFINGDAISGNVRSIEANNIKFATSYATLDVPLERVARMRLANPSAATNAPVVSAVAAPANVTRCFFNEHDAVTLRIDKLADEVISGTAEGIGALKLPLGAFSALEFNPSVKRTNDGDDDEL